MRVGSQGGAQERRAQKEWAQRQASQKGDLREPKGVLVGVPWKGIPRGTTKPGGHQKFQFGH